MRSKYRNIKTTYKGAVYQSAKEANRAHELDMLLLAGEIKSWERQIKVPLHGVIEEGHAGAGNKIKVCDYIVDFRVTDNNDDIHWEEVKGTWTKVGRMKFNFFKLIYPDWDIRIL